MDPQPNQAAGPRLPTAEAIGLMNQNAAAVANRSRFASAIQGQQRVGRDALRRDRQIRQLDPTTVIPGTREVPADAPPTATPTFPMEELRNLLEQFEGVGTTGGGGGGIGVGGGTTIRRTSGGGDGTPSTPSTSSSGGSTSGVQTFTRDGGRDSGRPVSVPVRTFTRDGPEGGVEGGGVRESPSSEVTTFRRDGPTNSTPTEAPIETPHGWERFQPGTDPRVIWFRRMNSNGIWEYKRPGQ